MKGHHLFTLALVAAAAYWVGNKHGASAQKLADQQAANPLNPLGTGQAWLQQNLNAPATTGAAGG